MLGTIIFGLVTPEHWMMYTTQGARKIQTLQQWACSQRSESCSESRSDHDLFLIGFVIWTTCVHKHCNCRPDLKQDLRGNMSFLLRLLTLWPMHGFSTHFQNLNKRTIQLYAHAWIMFWKSCVHKSSESDFLGGSGLKMPFFRILKAWFERASRRVNQVFKSRNGLNHDPKQLLEHDSLLCEQAQCVFHETWSSDEGNTVTILHDG